MPNGQPAQLANLNPPFKPGESGNPSGRPTAGATIREWFNQLVFDGLNEAGLRKISRDRELPAAKRIAAERVLKTLESGDIADYAEWLSGQKTLRQLRDEGLNTEVIKKAKITDKGGRELELHDRAGAEVDRIMQHTELTIGEIEKNARLDAGKPTENIAGIEVVIPGMK